MLTISSEKNKKRRKEITSYRKEFSYQSSRSFNLRITRMKTKSMLIIKMAYCMFIAKKEGGKKKTAKTIAIK
jgi:hypothetical protein